MFPSPFVCTFLSQGVSSARPHSLSAQGCPEASCVQAALTGAQVGGRTWRRPSLWLSGHSYGERGLRGPRARRRGASGARERLPRALGKWDSCSRAWAGVTGIPGGQVQPTCSPTATPESDGDTTASTQDAGDAAGPCEKRLVTEPCLNCLSGWETKHRACGLLS